MFKILIIEDDKSIRDGLISLLVSSNYLPLTLEMDQITVDKIKESKPDLILLDINLPEINGRDFVREIRKSLNTPIIMVTSQNTEMDEALSISYGADDFITKPYNPTILLLRIAAILRRTNSISDTINYRNLQVDFKKGIISKINPNSKNIPTDCFKKQTIELTKNELLIFRTLLFNQERIVSRNELMTELWDNCEYINDNALTVNISRLRDKLEKLGEKDTIETRKGLGYILN
jgi:hypothetical protein